MSDLTLRERQVARLTADGRTSREIAAELGIAVQTVKHHRSSIYLKLGVRNAVEFTRAWLTRLGESSHED